MPSKKTWLPVGAFILITTLFALAYNQSPLYTSNQYQYFLHGLAHAGEGTLSADWLANTLDPAPLFSLLVEITTRFHAPPLFYVYYALIMGAYLFSLIGILDTVFPLRKSPLTLTLILSVTILLHSAGLRYLISRSLGPDWTYVLEGGVAGQRLLGPVFQPSVFGVFLLLSICLYLRRKPVWAVLSAVFAATIHPTYLLSAATLVLTFLVDTFFLEGRKRPAVLMGLLALVTVTPSLVYTLSVFVSGSPEEAARAHDILVNFRIPHHAIVTNWFNATVVVKLIILGGTLFLVRRSRLFLLIGLPFAVSLLLTLVQFFTGNQSLALLFPWRLSTWLVPLALAAMVGQAINWLVKTVRERYVPALKIISFGLVILAVGAGVTRSWLEAGEARMSPARPLQDYVSTHRLPGEVYLIPVKMYDFRLNAGVPVYGEFFSIPYQNNDVLEWYQRFLNTKYFYDLADCSRLPELAAQGVTHVILPADYPVDCPSLTPLYEDDSYELFLMGSE